MHGVFHVLQAGHVPLGVAEAGTEATALPAAIADQGHLSEEIEAHLKIDQGHLSEEIEAHLKIDQGHPSEEIEAHLKIDQGHPSEEIEAHLKIDPGALRLPSLGSIVVLLKTVLKGAHLLGMVRWSQTKMGLITVMVPE